MNQELLPTRKGKAPAAEPAPPTNDNLARKDPTDFDSVNMRIPHDKKMEMWNFAKERGLSLTRLFIDAFDYYKERNA